jgi:antitoxin component YwqK of YwqJK toxin-antitoxin module
VVFHVDYYFISNEYYIFSERDKRFITTAIEFEADKFLEGKSDYFIIRDVIDNYLKYAIFNKDGNQIPEWFDRIHPCCLVAGYSNYYIVANNGKYAIFNKDGNQISDWFYEIYPNGLVNGESDYYLAKKR